MKRGRPTLESQKEFAIKTISKQEKKDLKH